jgi:hypothetical protein
MKRKKYLKIGLISFAVFLCQKTSAQKIAEQIYSDFSAPIISKIYEKVISKVQLSTASQIFLANAYKEQYEQEIYHLRNNMLTVLNLKRYKDSSDYAIEEKLKKVLTPREIKLYDSAIIATRDFATPIFDDVIVPDAEMNSQFGIAMKYKKLLRLRDSQIDSIKNYAIALKSKIVFAKANPDSGFFDKAAFESENLSKVLNDNQYLVLLNEKNKVQSEIQARYLWHALTEKGLHKKFNKEQSLKELLIYYIIRANFTDRFANEKQRRNIMIKALKLPEPLLIYQQSLKTEKEKLEKYAW